MSLKILACTLTDNCNIQSTPNGAASCPIPATLAEKGTAADARCRRHPPPHPSRARLSALLYTSAVAPTSCGPRLLPDIMSRLAASSVVRLGLLGAGAFFNRALAQVEAGQHEIKAALAASVERQKAALAAAEERWAAALAVAEEWWAAALELGLGDVKAEVRALQARMDAALQVRRAGRGRRQHLPWAPARVQRLPRCTGVWQCQTPQLIRAPCPSCAGPLSSPTAHPATAEGGRHAAVMPAASDAPALGACMPSQIRTNPCIFTCLAFLSSFFSLLTFCGTCSCLPLFSRPYPFSHDHVVSPCTHYL